ncbi:MAG: hypothetical protein ACYSP9_00895, partial [Planctomycetota bacterium]
ICFGSDDDFAVWRADENGDGQINIGELVYIERGPARNRLMHCEFPSSDNSPIDLGSIRPLSTNWWLPYSSEVSCTPLIPQCGNVQFAFDAWPPQTTSVTVSFNVQEDGNVRQNQISASLRGWAENILNSSGDGFVADDD